MSATRDSTRDRGTVLLLIVAAFALFDVLGVSLVDLGALLLRVGLIELAGWLLGSAGSGAG